MRPFPMAIAAAQLCVAAIAQLPCTLQVDGCAGGVRVGGATFAAAGRSVLTELQPGGWRLVFAPAGGGRPAPIDVVAPAAGRISVRVEAPPRPDENATVLAAESNGARTFPIGAAAAGARTGSEGSGGDGSDARVRARVQIVRGGAPIGLVARWQDDTEHYRFVWDAAAGELRLERVLGGSVLVLHKATAPGLATDREWHELELEVEGFRMLALCDDEPIARVLDGALSVGRVGTYGNATAQFADLTAAPPAVPLATTVASAAGRELTLCARAPLAVDGTFALCLCLDRPTALWPTGDGFEPWLLQPPAEPAFAVFAVGCVDRDGGLSGSLAWPDGVALRLQAALVGGFLGTPDAEALAGRLPWADVRL